MATFTTSPSITPSITNSQPLPTTLVIPSSNNQSCNTPLDYALVRKNNIAIITNNYNKLIDTYTQSYTDYSKQNVSTNLNDRTYADKTLKPQVAAYNTQIINISKELMNNINKDTDLIVEQTTELEKKTQNLNKLLDDIKILKEQNAELGVTEKSQEDNVRNTQTGSDDLHFTSQIYMGINILLICIVIGLIIYLVYSNSTSKSNNTNANSTANTNANTSTNTGSNTSSSINNIYKSIKVNNPKK